ncbi:hypothetical protein BGZ82_009971 [Podila clonocystis]|nr:hypothetical protein BGZ82_009971 [Podila clonocystis]
MTVMSLTRLRMRQTLIAELDDCGTMANSKDIIHNMLSKLPSSIKPSWIGMAIKDSRGYIANMLQAPLISYFRNIVLIYQKAVENDTDMNPIHSPSKVFLLLFSLPN